MKTNQLKTLGWILSVLIAFGLVSCRKDNSDGLSFEPGKGEPTITSVHTLNKTDTVGGTKEVITYNSSGVPSTSTAGTAPAVTAFDSTTVTGNPGQMYVIYGTNLGSATKITFNGIAAYFNRALITDQSLVVAIPGNAPTVGPAATSKLVVTTLYGSVTYNFTVLPPPPTINEVSNYNFNSGSNITLIGRGFEAVTSVSLVNGGATATVVSKNDSVLVLQMPNTTVNSSLLKFTYTSLAQPGKVLTRNSTVEFVNFDNAYKVFTEGFDNGFQDASWSATTISTTVSKGGSKSFGMVFKAGSWSQMGFGWSPVPKSMSATYKYLTFWVKGGSKDYPLYIWTDASKSGNGTFEDYNKITVPKNVWTYFKIPLDKLQLWANGDSFTQIGWRLQGPDGTDETFYLDDVAYIK